MMKFFSDMANRRAECDTTDVRYRTQTTEAPEDTDSAVIRTDRCICGISPSDSMYTGCTPASVVYQHDQSACGEDDKRDYPRHDCP